MTVEATTRRPEGEDDHELATMFTHDPTTDAFRPRRNWARPVAAVVILTLLGTLTLGLAVALSRPAPSVEPTVAPAAAADVGEPEADAAAPEPVSNADVTAVSWQGTALPISASAGPRDFSATRSKGFAQSPMGAALAAAHISSHMDPYTGPAVFKPTITQQVTGDTEAMLASVQQTYTAQAKRLGVKNGAPILAPTGSMIAWRIDRYSDTGVNDVEVYVQTPTGKDVIYTVPVQWVDGDWKVTPTPGQASIFAISTPDPSTEYTAFTPTTSIPTGD